MPDDKDLDIRKVFEQATNRMSLQDLAQQGFHKVKVLDEEAVQKMVADAVDRAITMQTAGERERILENSRRELDKLLRDHKAAASRAKLLEADKNELVGRVENLERQLQLKEDLEEETLHKRVQEGLASLQGQVEDLRERYQSSLRELEAARTRTADLSTQLQARSAKEAELWEKFQDIRGTHDAALAELEDLHKEAERLRADRDRVEQEAEATLAKLGTLEKQVVEEQSRARAAEKTRSDLVGQILGLQTKEQSASGEIGRMREALAQAQTEAAGLRETLEKEREKSLRAESAGEDILKRLEALSAEAAAARKDREAAVADAEESRQEAQRTAEEAEGLRSEVESAHQEVSFLKGQLAQQQKDQEDQKQRTVFVTAELQAIEEQQEKEKEELEQALEDAERVRGRAGEVERQLEEARGQLVARTEEVEKSRREIAYLQGQLAQQQKDQEDQKQKTVFVTAELQAVEERQEKEKEKLERALADAARIQERADEVERQLAEARGRAESAREQLVVRTDEVEKSRREIAYLQGQIAQLQKDYEDQKQKTVFAESELQGIEERQKTEHDDLERLRAQVVRGAEDKVQLEKNVAEARSEVQALQELLGREQEAARQAQNEAASVQARLMDLQERLQVAARDAEVLRVEKAALAERSEEGFRLDRLERILDSAQKSSTVARASAVRSRETAAELERTLARQQRPKKRKRNRGGTIRGAAAYDGMALLENFFRKIRLKEHFQKYVPVQERPGERHPSEMLVEVLKAIAAGDRRPEKEGRAVPLEIVGPSDGPDAERLRLFLGRLSPQAVRAIGQVHHALRLHLYAPPRKPEPLVLDVADLELGLGRKRANRAVRPLLCFDPAREEFWNGHYRGNRPPGVAEIPGFLSECLGRVPSPFARKRIRLRMDSGYFNEGVVRLLNAKGCGYVIAAPDTRGIRKGARACAFTKLSNGWEVGEFRLRLHPIRKTEARFVVVRRRDSKKAREEGPALFRDERHVYHVFATDARGTPWRSFEFYRGRESALERARALLSDFTTSRLRGRSRRAVAALFQASLLASDLVAWFRRSCLPADEKGRGAEELRSDFLMVPAGSGKSLLVMPRKDRRRKLFARVDRLTRRLRAARPFKYRK